MKRETDHLSKLNDRYEYPDFNWDVVEPSNQEIQWLNNAFKVSRLHEKSGGRYNMAAIVAKGGRIRSVGKNFYRKSGKAKREDYDVLSIHAELHAILQTEGNLKGHTIYIAGHSNNRNMANTQPCRFCMQTIKDAGIKKIVFCDEDKPVKIILR